MRERLDLWRSLQDMKVWLAEVREHTYTGMDTEFRDRWLRWIEQHVENSAVEAVRFPQFEREPTYEERTKHGLWAL